MRVAEFSGRHSDRESDTIHQTDNLDRSRAGKRLTYDELIAPNGLGSGGRSSAAVSSAPSASSSPPTRTAGGEASTKRQVASGVRAAVSRTSRIPAARLTPWAALTTPGGSAESVLRQAPHTR